MEEVVSRQAPGKKLPYQVLCDQGVWGSLGLQCPAMKSNSPCCFCPVFSYSSTIRYDS